METEVCSGGRVVNGTPHHWHPFQCPRWAMGVKAGGGRDEAATGERVAELPAAERGRSWVSAGFTVALSWSRHPVWGGGGSTWRLCCC